MVEHCEFKVSDMDGPAFVSFAEAAGWEEVGRGMFGRALAKGDKVWKVQFGHGKGWGAYITMVATGRLSGPHVPKVYQLVRLACGGVAALMERLVSSRVVYGRQAQPYSEGLQMVADGGHWDPERAGPAASELCHRWPALCAFLKAATGLLGNLNDLHTGNFMARSDGTLVVTDPIT